MENWVCVFSSDQVHKAELAKKILTEENIEAIVLNKKDSAYTTFGEVELYVQPEDENLAIELIKSFEIE